MKVFPQTVSKSSVIPFSLFDPQALPSLLQLSFFFPHTEARSKINFDLREAVGVAHTPLFGLKTDRSLVCLPGSQDWHVSSLHLHILPHTHICMPASCLLSPHTAPFQPYPPSNAEKYAPYLMLKAVVLHAPYSVQWARLEALSWPFWDALPFGIGMTLTFPL